MPEGASSFFNPSLERGQIIFRNFGRVNSDIMRFISTIILSATAALTLAAAPIDEGKRLYDKGDYEGALEQFQALQRKSPRDGSANYWLGATLVALDRPDDARPYLTTAENRGVADAALALADLEARAYRPDEAVEHLDEYERLLRKNKRAVPDDLEERRSRLVTMENMLSRVEKIAVIDSMAVDADEFFRAYRLSPESGRFVSGATARLPQAEMAFMPQNNTEIIYSQPDSAGTFTLYSADILDDGTLDRARPLQGENLGGGGNAEYPFMLSDGLTLYYANDGEESLGGYDIFMTRRDGDGGFLQPQNIGMPYNSPDDDYLLAIDETTGAGWWATDRNHIPGKVTIYVFVPSDTRVNVDSDDPNLTALARLDDISLTQTPGTDYSAVRERIAAAATSSADNIRPTASAFELPIGSTTVIYRNLSDFKSPQARQLMAKAIDTRARINSITAKLSALREAYRGGDRSSAISITNLEEELDRARHEYDVLVNKAISAELRR